MKYRLPPLLKFEPKPLPYVLMFFWPFRSLFTEDAKLQNILNDRFKAFGYHSFRCTIATIVQVVAADFVTGNFLYLQKLLKLYANGL